MLRIKPWGSRFFLSSQITVMENKLKYINENNNEKQDNI